MTATPKLVTIFGGSGFVGRYVAQKMAKQGWRVRVAVRRPNEAIFVKPYGVVGQVEPILANIRDDASTAAAIAGADAVVNCVGILAETSRQKFENVQADGAERIARLTKAAGARLVHVSAIGADANSLSEYARTKAEGEAAVQQHMSNAVILRPSIIFGTEDQFFNRFAGIAKASPFVPVVGGTSLFQPVHVTDVAEAAVQGVLGNAKAGIYELGGPDVETMGQLMDRLLASTRRKRIKLPVPFSAASLMGWKLDLLSKLTFGLFRNTLITQDQVRLLRSDNVVSAKAKTFADLGIVPTSMDAVLDTYLYAHRPYGQYAELTESSKNLTM
jgi:NADH dehydrogenase